MSFKKYKEILGLIEEQSNWRGSCLNMIASENVTSSSVRKAVSSDFGHRYAEGVLGGFENKKKIFNRFYQGTRIFDKIEETGMNLAEELFNAEHANLVPISGAVANLTVYQALCNHGDEIMGLNIPCGGHISHTHVSSAGVKGLKDISYPFENHEMNIDIEKTKKLIAEKKPRLLILGASLFLFPHPVKELSETAKEFNALTLYDGAHVLGLMAGKKFQDPFKEGADVITASTHKSFPGPQKGIILCKEKFSKKIDNAAFPGLMSNHHLNNVAGLALTLLEMKEFGEEYASQTIKNAKALAGELYSMGFNVLCEHKNFTESHQVAVDVSSIGKGKKIAEKFEEANIIINKNLLPWDSLSDTDNPSGIRLGVSELTRIGMKENEMKEISLIMRRIAIDSEPANKVRNDVAELMKGFKTVKYCFEEGPAY